MINANELRIGNWILPKHDLDGKYHRVERLMYRVVNAYTENWYSPIPITPEILEKIGKRITPVFINDLEQYWKIGKFVWPENHPALLKSVHWLQNYYYYFSNGEELEIKNLAQESVMHH